MDCGAAYGCFTTEDEISVLREEQKNKGLPPKHDNRHRGLSKEEIKHSYPKEDFSNKVKIDEKIEIKWVDR